MDVCDKYKKMLVDQNLNGILESVLVFTRDKEIYFASESGMDSSEILEFLKWAIEQHENELKE